MTELLEVDQVTVSYDGLAVVQDVCFNVAQGQIACLVGASGCGKTTLLRAIAGFEQIQSGEIRLQGQTVSLKGWELPPERRRVGMVFQDFALFPHLTVADNIAFGIQHLPQAQRLARVAELLELIELAAYERSYPHQLSGGQQQRIALARAIAPKPALLLLDEPFSSMDVEMREQLAREVRGILKQEAISGLLVTHDQYEAFAMADEIGVLNEGRLVQWDTGYNLYHKPSDRFVGDFIGQGVLLPGTVLNDQQVEIELGIIQGDEPHGFAKGHLVDVLVRPDDILHDDHSGMQAAVRAKAFRGAEFLYTLQLPSGSHVLCMAHSHHDHAIDERIGIRLEIDHLVMFER